MELRILNTLWTKQVNRIENWPLRRFGFRRGSDEPEFAQFAQSVNKLALEGLVAPDQQRMVCLTDHGFEFCRKHHDRLGEQQWWEDERLDPGKLAKALQQN